MLVCGVWAQIFRVEQLWNKLRIGVITWDGETAP